MFKGIAASPGIVVGRAVVYRKQVPVVDQSHITASETATEETKLDKAVRLSRDQLVALREKVAQELGADQAAIFEAHLMMLEDPVFIPEVKAVIRQGLIRAEYALFKVVEKHVQNFNAIEDPYLKERAVDLKDIGERIAGNLLGPAFSTLDDLPADAVILAHDLTPSDTVSLDKSRCKAFVTEIGSRTSHTAIMARSMEIPAVVGVGGIIDNIKDGSLIVVDGNEGLVLIDPERATLDSYIWKQQEHWLFLRQLEELKDLPAETACGGRRVELSANIGTPEDCASALANGAEGVGLFRTEFLYMDRDRLPDEEEQFEAYKAVILAMAPRWVIIRTLDIGGDKRLPYLSLPEEMNPFLGVRAIRLSLERPDIFKIQLRAILRAGAHGNLRIMYPMIADVSEIRAANVVLAQARAELQSEGLTCASELPVGIMIETPAAALTADLLAAEVDFFSIGSNDLIQYTMAADRMNERLSSLYEPLHPAVLRQIKHVIDASHRAGKWTGMCGEMAGSEEAVPLLLGLGLDEYSMDAASIPRVKKIIRALTYVRVKDIAQQALALSASESVRELMAGVLRETLS